MPKNRPQNEENVDTMTAVEAEQPKQKVGDAPTTVDSKEKKSRGPAIRSTGIFRLRDGVTADKFNGQRKAVVAALIKLRDAQGDRGYSLEEIVGQTEGLVSKHPVAASALWHLKGLIANKEVEFSQQEKSSAEQPASESAAA
jgi:hypothetical protein